ncbi:hypothetical protein MT418_003934 [Batrachochytrium dendrobatidis]
MNGIDRNNIEGDGMDQVLDSELMDAKSLAEMKTEHVALDLQSKFQQDVVQQMKERKELLLKQAVMRKQLCHKRLEFERLQSEVAQLEKDSTAGIDVLHSLPLVGLKRGYPTDSISETTASKKYNTPLLSSQKNSTQSNLNLIQRPCNIETIKSISVQPEIQKKQSLAKTSVHATATKKPLIHNQRQPVPQIAPIVDTPVEIEPISGFRIKNRLVSKDQFAERMLNRQVIPISQIRSNMTDNDIIGDWVVIGIIIFKSECKKTKDGDVFCMLRIGDLRGSSVNLFMFRDVCQSHSNEQVGSLVAILNPKIIRPSESRATLGLDLDHTKKWMKIADFTDLGYCKGTLQNNKCCSQPIDRMQGQYCEIHLSSNYKSAKSNRQEFASGNAAFHVGNPSKKLSGKQRSYSNDGTYVLSGQTLSTTHTGVDAVAQRKESLPPILNAKQVLEIKSLMSSNTAGARSLRALNKSLDCPAPAGMASIFGPAAIARMGGNPISGDRFKPVVNSSQLVSLPGLTSPSKSLKTTQPVNPMLKSISEPRLSMVRKDISRIQSAHVLARSKSNVQKDKSPPSSDVELEILD